MIFIWKYSEDTDADENKNKNEHTKRGPDVNEQDQIAEIKKNKIMIELLQN